MIQFFGKPKKQRVFVNTLTDTGGAFEIGNSLIAWPNPAAMAFNLIVAVIAYTARAVGEMKAEKMNVPRFLERVPKNLGTSLIISGAGLIGSAVFKGLSDGWSLSFIQDSANPIFASASVILLSFGLANAFRGYARGLIQGGMIQKLLDSSGIILATFGVMASVPESSFWVKGLLIAAAVFETALSCGAKKIPVGTADFVFAAACSGNALSGFFAAHPLMGAANVIFALAVVSLGALKRKGGFYQMLLGSKV